MWFISDYDIITRKAGNEISKDYHSIKIKIAFNNSMTKKDYIMIAREISELIKGREATPNEKLTVMAFCSAFHRDNSRFDDGKFIKACLINSKENGK